MPSLYLLIITVFILIPAKVLSAPTINSQCDFYQDIALGQEYFIYNSEFPQNYSSARSCRWTGQSPWGTVIVFSCTIVAIPYSRNCQKDKLLFSLNGDENFNSNNVSYYCGKTSFTATTYANHMAIGLFSADGSIGGNFLCSLAAMRVGPQDCNCGFKGRMRIVGGEETGVNEFPSMSGLIDLSKEEVFCGSSIIAKRYAVTAAHCLQRQTFNNIELLVGAHNLNSDVTQNHRISIASFVQHSRYEVSTQENDIAVVKTSKEIIYNFAVSPICLPFLYRQYNFLGVTALGWGYTDFSGYRADTLQKVDLGVISNQECDAALTEDIQTTQMCTFGDGKDACISDSGGPLVWQDQNSGKLELVGIISYGLGCATKKPAVNTRVTLFLSWIASVTSDAEFCIQ